MNQLVVSEVRAAGLSAIRHSLFASKIRLAKVQAHISKALSYESTHGTGFLLGVTMIGAGIVWHLTSPVAFPASLIAGLFLLFASLWWVMPHGWLKPLLLAAALFSSGIASSTWQEHRLATPMLGSVVNTTVTARVLRIDKREDGSLRYLLDIAQTQRPTLRYAPDRVLITQRSKETDAVGVGDVVQARVRLMPANGPVMPGSYDFGFNAYFRGIGGNGFAMGKVNLVEKAQGSATAAILIERMRTRLADHIRSRIDGVDGEIAAALVAGVRSGIPEHVNEALRQTGLAHVLSISGLHMAMVAGFVMSVLRVCFACIPGLASRYPVKKFAAVLALFVAAFYLALSGADVAARRSFLMIAIMLIAVIFDRAALTIRNVALSALVIFAVSPHEILGPSFQMSYAATIALISAYAAWTRRKRVARWWFIKSNGTAQRVLGYFGGLAMTSIVAGLATTLYGAYHFYRVSPMSLPANLLAMPAASIFMPAGVLGVVAMPFGIDAPFFYVMGKGIAVMNAIAIWLANLSPNDAVGAISGMSLASLTVAFLLLTLLATRLRLLCIPFACLGFLWLFLRDTPDILISENGKVVAVRLADGKLALNNARGSTFTISNWRYATQASSAVGPQKAETLESAEPDLAYFRCLGKTCRIERNGQSIWTTDTADNARPLCATADLIVIGADATATNICPGKSIRIVTLRDLARKGAATIFLDSGAQADATLETHGAVAGQTGAAPPIERLRIVYSVSEPYRGWHAYRQYSREARGMPPFQSRPRPETLSPAITTPETPTRQQAFQPPADED